MMKPFVFNLFVISASIILFLGNVSGQDIFTERATDTFGNQVTIERHNLTGVASRRIETGKPFPLSRHIAENQNRLVVSSDYLLDDSGDDIAPVQIKDKALTEKLNLVDSLPEQDK